MAKRSDIWCFLREHETPPPPELFQRIRASLTAIDENNRSGSSSNNESSMARLRQLEIAPPAFVSASIKDRIEKLRKGRIPPIRGVSRKRWIYAGIAASFFVLIGFSIFRIFVPVEPSHKPTVVKNIPESTPARQTKIPVTGDSIETAMSRPADDSSARMTDLAKSGTMAISVRNNGTVILDGHPIRLIDNDPLFTFISFRYPEIGGYMDAKKEEDLTIRVDRYTNITISKQAAAMIREMYMTRSNGKPTRRARKTRQKLEDWKRTDEKRFDGALPFNPIDPLDLGELILK
ncbi:MAG: hypothetical protein JST68_11890 [Bacteroidetes bacterium]|nr:hypothetical protein [Bacteroidota bacterium]